MTHGGGHHQHPHHRHHHHHHSYGSGSGSGSGEGHNDNSNNVDFYKGGRREGEHNGPLLSWGHAGAAAGAAAGGGGGNRHHLRGSSADSAGSYFDPLPRPDNYERDKEGTIDCNNDECKGICTMFCCCFCCGVFHPADFTPLHHRLGFWFFLSCCTLALLALSFALSIRLQSLQFTLDIGETRQITIPKMTWELQSITIRAMSQNPGLNVFVIPPNPPFSSNQAICPPLLGPTMTLADDEDIVLAVDDYQYDYFFLNPGSTITMDITPTAGSTNVFLLRGTAALSALESQQESFSFRRHSERKWFVGETMPLSFTHQAQHSDVYIIVYDNASTYWRSSTKLHIHYNVQITTHALATYEPRCTPIESVQGCQWNMLSSSSSSPSSSLVNDPKLSSSCIIVQSVAIGKLPPPPPPLPPQRGNDTVTVHLDMVINWKRILGIAALPFLIGLIWWSWIHLFGDCISIWYSTNNGDGSGGDDDDDDDDDRRRQDRHWCNNKGCCYSCSWFCCCCCCRRRPKPLDPAEMEYIKEETVPFFPSTTTTTTTTISSSPAPTATTANTTLTTLGYYYETMDTPIEAKAIFVETDNESSSENDLFYSSRDGGTIPILAAHLIPIPPPPPPPQHDIHTQKNNETV